MTTGNENTSDRDATELMRSEQPFVELEGLLKCPAAVCSKLDFSELPDLEEVDAHKEILLPRVSAVYPPSTDTVDPELEGLD